MKKRGVVLVALAAIALSVSSCDLLGLLDLFGGLEDEATVNVATLSGVMDISPITSGEYTNRAYWTSRSLASNNDYHWYRVSGLSSSVTHYIHWQDHDGYDAESGEPPADIKVSLYSSDGVRITGPQDAGYDATPASSGSGYGIAATGYSTYYIKVVPYSSTSDVGQYYICVY